MKTPREAGIGPVVLPATEAHALESGGRPYSIFIARPVGQIAPEGAPVLYLLDANATFGTVVEAIRLRARRPDVTGVVPTAVVGIGYPVEGPYDRARRTYDFTPEPPPSTVASDGGSGAGDAHGSAPANDAARDHGADASAVDARSAGGADAFHKFLLGPVRALVADRVDVDVARQAIFGHSLAGFFVLRTLLRTPDAFRTYVAASPSIWFDETALMADAMTLPDRLGATADVRVMIGAGEYDEVLAPWERSGDAAHEIEARRAQRRIVSRARTLAERLGAHGHPRLSVRFDLYEGEDHASAVLRTIGACLRFVLAPVVAATADVQPPRPAPPSTSS